jgi:hypothetical protein
VAGRAQLGCISLLGLTLVFASACEPTNWTRRDDFVARLKTGCHSQKECGALVGEAQDRFMDCAQRLHVILHQANRVGRNDVKPRLERCSYELGDLQTAYADYRRFRGENRVVAGTVGGPVEAATPLDVAEEQKSEPAPATSAAP